jgi:hypothetical protein
LGASLELTDFHANVQIMEKVVFTVKCGLVK